MDNQSNDSDREIEISESQTKKPNNRNIYEHKCFIISSQFPGGNMRAALFQEEFRMEGKIALVVEFWGNSDAQSDPLDKSWFYFQVSGIKQLAKLNYEEIIFRFKNANNLRKFIREKRFKPYVVYKQLAQSDAQQWRTIFISKMNILQSQIIEAQFVYPINPAIDSVYFAQNLPYSMKDLEYLHENISSNMGAKTMNSIYYNRQIIAKSVDEFPIYMCTITSMRNLIEDNQIVGRPDKIDNEKVGKVSLKNRPEIVITSRVHPSQTSSSFCVEGIIQSLIKNQQFCMLLELFIFRIIPMINPDGVENGHYRLDNYLQNLNRYYGHSDVVKTPSVFAIQKIITNLREKSKLFLFMDIHGHNSPKHSFVFGNFCQNIYQTLQNKTFVKLLQVISPGNFDYVGCEFSKRNMTIKQKYDEHSKEASARVFAYRGNSQQQNNQIENKGTQFVEHSYTLEIHPYIICDPGVRKNLIKKLSKQNSGSRKNIFKNMIIKNNSDQVPLVMEANETDIIFEYKKIGQAVLVAILQLIGVNCFTKLKQSQDSFCIRKKHLKEISKSVQYYDRSKKLKLKEINKQILDRYYQRWNILESYKQFIDARVKNGEIKQRLKQCPIHYFYEEWLVKRDKLEQMNIRRMKILQRKDKMLSGREKEQVQPLTQDKQDNLRSTNQNADIASQPCKMTTEPDQNKKSNVLKTKQFEIIQKIENRHSNSVGYKKARTPQLSQIEQLERKIKKLMFRHRTQVQIPENQNNNNPSKYETLGQRLDSKFEEDYIKSRKITINQKSLKKKIVNTNKLEPLGKLGKAKIFHMKTEQYGHHQLEFNDYNINEGKQKMSNGRIDRLESLKPRIQQFVKKLSEHKQDLETLENQDIMQIKSTALAAQKKKNTRCSYQYLKETQKIEPYNPQQQMPMYCNIVEYKQINKVHEDQSLMSLFKGRLAGCHKSVKSKLQNIETGSIQGNQQQVHNIVKSFRVLAGDNSNRQQFLQKAKKILSEKKRQYKTIDEPYLPTINEAQCYDGIKKPRGKGSNEGI